MGNAASRRSEANKLIKSGSEQDLARVLELLRQHPDLLVMRDDLSSVTTVFHAAAKSGQIAALQMLLDFFRSDASPYAALMPDQKEERLMQLLDVPNSKEETALSITCSLGHHECTALLTSLGASPIRPDVNTLTPMHHAAKAGHAKCLLAIMENMPQDFRRESYGFARPYDVTTTHGIAPLHFAVAGDHMECVEVLIKYGASLTPQTKLFTTELGHILQAGSTPLHVAAKCGFMEIAQLLIRTDAHNTSSNHVSAKFIKDSEGKTPFQLMRNDGPLSGKEAAFSDVLNPVADAAHNPAVKLDLEETWI